MMNRSIASMLAGALLATVVPAAAAAGPNGLDEGWVPGCRTGFFEWPGGQEVAGLRNPAYRGSDANGDGLRCAQIQYDRQTFEMVAVRWADNRDWVDPVKVYW
jgi:hypothetical protein